MTDEKVDKAKKEYKKARMDAHITRMYKTIAKAKSRGTQSGPKPWKDYPRKADFKDDFYDK